ncbi:hypothetical protein JCM10908_005193 [Rhodotorula pacifica]|uniref:uncharacterized protein n=1 Tax=Rhodotorula pacifica TaxID=1495444 RepID=UPI0031799728
MSLARDCMQQCVRAVQRAARPRSSGPRLLVVAAPQACRRHFTSTSSSRADAPLPWFVDPQTAPTGPSALHDAVEDADDLSATPRLATAPVPTLPPAHLSPALHPLHDFLSTSPFLDKDSLVYIHAREADPDASWCDWIVCATLRHGRERGLRGAIEGVKRHLAANPVELPLVDSSSGSSAPPPFAPPSTRPEIHGLPTTPTKHARSRNLRTSRSSSSSSRSPSASDAGTGWALLDAGTLVVHVFTPQARETYGRTIEQMWERIGEAEHAQRGLTATTVAAEAGGWKSSARREEERKRAEELERNMDEVKREMQLEAEEEARRRTA